MPTPTMFTKTEAARRLRLIAKEARGLDRQLKQNFKVEVGTRTVLHRAPTIVEAARLPEDDDLADQMTIDEAVRYDFDTRCHGYVAHLYFAEPGAYGELVAVVTGWLGTPDADPVLLFNDNRYTHPAIVEAGR